MRVLNFKRSFVVFFLLLGSIALLNVSSAQARRTGWRCPGNVYTNDQNLVKKLGNCQQLDVTLTVMPGGRSGARARSQGSGGTSTQARPATDSSMRVAPAQQQSRDSDAKKLIEAELSKKQSELAMLQGQYNSGKPERLASEIANEAAYQERTERLSREIERKVSEIAAIQNELSRH